MGQNNSVLTRGCMRASPNTKLSNKDFEIVTPTKIDKAKIDKADETQSENTEENEDSPNARTIYSPEGSKPEPRKLSKEFAEVDKLNNIVQSMNEIARSNSDEAPEKSSVVASKKEINNENVISAKGCCNLSSKGFLLKAFIGLVIAIMVSQVAYILYGYGSKGVSQASPKSYFVENFEKVVQSEVLPDTPLNDASTTGLERIQENKSSETEEEMRETKTIIEAIETAVEEIAREEASVDEMAPVSDAVVPESVVDAVDEPVTSHESEPMETDQEEIVEAVAEVMHDGESDDSIVSEAIPEAVVVSEVASVPVMGDAVETEKAAEEAITEIPVDSSLEQPIESLPLADMLFSSNMEEEEEVLSPKKISKHMYEFTAASGNNVAANMLDSVRAQFQHLFTSNPPVEEESEVAGNSTLESTEETEPASSAPRLKRGWGLVNKVVDLPKPSEEFVAKAADVESNIQIDARS
mmetsp:Transcript_36302/g.36975  ORF Transcript_36302/g.36975 Transcript_36302/m.36975 type:complete len:468 (-) Transcript_36302:339-1742(-)